MKKWVYTLVVVLFLVFTANYFYSAFSLVSEAKLSREVTRIDENYYLGYSLNWRGLLKPEIVEISLRNKDGSLINEENTEEVEVVPFIDIDKHTGSFDETSFQEYLSEGFEYVPATKADIEGDNLLVLRISIKDDAYINTVDTMIVNYKILGFPKKQIVKFDGFIQ